MDANLLQLLLWAIGGEAAVTLLAAGAILYYVNSVFDDMKTERLAMWAKINKNADDIATDGKANSDKFATKNDLLRVENNMGDRFDDVTRQLNTITNILMGRPN